MHRISIIALLAIAAVAHAEEPFDKASELIQAEERFVTTADGAKALIQTKAPQKFPAGIMDASGNPSDLSRLPKIELPKNALEIVRKGGKEIFDLYGESFPGWIKAEKNEEVTIKVKMPSIVTGAVQVHALDKGQIKKSFWGVFRDTVPGKSFDVGADGFVEIPIKIGDENGRYQFVISAGEVFDWTVAFWVGDEIQPATASGTTFTDPSQR